MPTLLGLSVMLPALFGAVLVHHPMFWPTPPASLDWAWACLRLLARSRYFCVSRSERWTGAANETHRRQERAGTRRNAAQPARARLALDARDGVGRP